MASAPTSNWIRCSLSLPASGCFIASHPGDFIFLQLLLSVQKVLADSKSLKYREPVNDLPSKKNKELVEALKEILG